MECQACGAELDPRDKFCSKCGAITERGKGAGEFVGRYVAQLADGFEKFFAAAFGYITNHENRKRVAVGGGVALVILISLTSNPISRGLGGPFSSTPDGPTYNDNGTPNFAEYEDVFLAEQGSYEVTGQANVRDFPTGEGTTVIGTLVAGETVEAREVMAFDQQSRWLKLASGGYVWGGNLVASGKPAPKTQLSFPASLIGRWSDHAECTGSGRETEVVVSASSVTIEQTRYDLANILGAGQELPGYEPEQSSGELSTIESIIVQEDARYPAIWIGDQDDIEGKSYRYYRSDYLCSDVRAIAELGTGM